MSPKTISRRCVRTAALATLVCLAWATADQAMAGCSGFERFAPPPAATGTGAPEHSTRFLSTVYRPGDGRFMQVSDDNWHGASVVGMWRVTLISDGTAYPGSLPPGTVADFGTQQWHSDGTEVLISGGRAPSTGDVCMGVWEQIGPRTFKLKHIALAYASGDTPITQHGPVVPAAYVGPGIIREVVTVSASGKTFEGSFTIDQYARDEVTLLQHIAGKITGTRFSVD